MTSIICTGDEGQYHLNRTESRTATHLRIRAVLRTFLAKCRLTPVSHDTLPSTLPIGRTHALYAVSAGVRSTRNEDGGIVLDIDRGQMFRLNPVGALILESLAKGCAEAEIAKEIAHQYNISEETAVADVLEFLPSLEEHKLVHTERGEKVS